MGFFHSTLIEWLNWITLVVYSLLTYLIALDTQKFFVSYTIYQEKKSSSKMVYDAVNNSKSEVDVFSRVWLKINGEVFTFKTGFYADKSSYPIQAFSRVRGGFDLKDLTNNSGMNLKEFVEKNDIDEIKFRIQIKYKKIGGRRWKISSPQQYIYFFKTNRFWLDV
jgi:hypothetical protein